MKTIILKSADESIKVEAKVDIFATNQQIDTEGFDTRFTGMEVITNKVSTRKGVDITQIEYSWQSIVSLTKSLGLGLYVMDINDTQNEQLQIIAPPSQILTPFKATSQTGDSVTNPDLGPLDVTYFHNGASALPQNGDVVYQDIYATQTLNNVGASGDNIQLGDRTYLATNASGVATIS